MMGRQVAQRERYELIDLEEFVPREHLLRAVDRYLDLTELRAHLANSYSHMWRPPVDPELMIRMLIIGYCYGIHSERRLCEEVHLDLPIVGSVISACTTRYRIIPPFPRIVMAAFVTAMHFASYSNRS
jgi:hypothetical protein